MLQEFFLISEKMKEGFQQYFFQDKAIGEHDFCEEFLMKQPPQLLEEEVWELARVLQSSLELGSRAVLSIKPLYL